MKKQYPHLLSFFWGRVILLAFLAAYAGILWVCYEVAGAR